MSQPRLHLPQALVASARGLFHRQSGAQLDAIARLHCIWRTTAPPERSARRAPPSVSLHRQHAHRTARRTGPRRVPVPGATQRRRAPGRRTPHDLFMREPEFLCSAQDRGGRLAPTVSAVVYDAAGSRCNSTPRSSPLAREDASWASPAVARLPPPLVLDAITVLVGSGRAHPAQSSLAVEAARPACGRLNAHLCQRARTSGESSRLPRDQRWRPAPGAALPGGARPGGRRARRKAHRSQPAG